MITYKQRREGSTHTHDIYYCGKKTKLTISATEKGFCVRIHQERKIPITLMDITGERDLAVAKRRFEALVNEFAEVPTADRRGGRVLRTTA